LERGLGGEAPSRRVGQVELIISGVLRYGVLLSFLVILLGSVLLFAEGGRSVTVRLSGGETPHNPIDAVTGALQLQPKAVIDLGLILLILIPVVHVAVAALAFFVEGDVAYTLIALFVLGVLLTSFLLGRGG
jgi:uncharacterized membrane protein